MKKIVVVTKLHVTQYSEEFITWYNKIYEILFTIWSFYKYPTCY